MSCQSTKNQSSISTATKIREIQEKLRLILPKVLDETGLAAESNVNAIIGSKSEIFIDQWNAVISTPQEYIDHWMGGLHNFLEKNPNNRYIRRFSEAILASSAYQDYIELFLERSFYKHKNEWSRPRPKPDEAEVWIGQNFNNYGILVSPRFKDKKWENDKSEIRHFCKKYWTIGHVLETGLVIPDKNEVIKFSGLAEFLVFYRNVLVRQSKSEYQQEISELYTSYLDNHRHPDDIPMLFPELRYGNAAKAHTYRVDYAIINQNNQRKIGFELSPWSTHGFLKGTKEKTQREINQDALKNFSRETLKARNFYIEKDMTILTYTDGDLKNISNIFHDIKIYLEQKQTIMPHRTFREHVNALIT